MSDFLKKFLLDDARRLSPNGRYAGLAAFGKHPGWDDHVEDLGLETESLILAKTVFYVSGIGGQIDAGTWEKLEPAQQFPSFKHVFVWQRSGQILVGRLWSSSDGKGRKRYPMVVCAHFTGVTLGWALKQALPVLAELEEGCLLSNTAEEVRSLLARKRAALREAVSAAESGGEYAAVSPDTLNRILKGGGEARVEGFQRVLYQLQSQLAGFAPGDSNARGGAVGQRAQQVRVPATVDQPEQALLFWTRFFLTQVDAGVPLLLTLALGESWLDVTVGEPESHEFFCLRATPKAVPLVSEVPYNLDAAFRTRAKSFLDGFERGETAPVVLQPAASPAVSSPTPAGGGSLKWVLLGLVVVVIAIVAVVVLTSGEKSAGPAKPAGNGTVTNAPAPTPEPAPKTEPPKPAAAPAKSPQQLAEEAAREVEAKKSAEALAAAAKLKADAEAAAQEQEQRLAEAARQKELEEKRQAEAEAAAKKKAEEEAAAAAAAARKTNAPAAATGSSLAAAKPGQTEMTNSIGMALVRLPSGLIVSKFEVTQAEFQKVMGMNPSKLPKENHPVEWVTKEDALEFCRKLSEMEQGSLGAAKYTLPTEAQWLEFRADQKFEDVPGGIKNGTTTPVGQFRPANKFGLADVLGNVWEWSLDAPEEKVLKGGAYNNDRYYEQAAPLGGKGSNCGFRCVVVSR